MKLVGYRRDGDVWIGRLGPDDRLTPLAEVETFYRDPAAHLAGAGEPSVARSEVVEAPAAPAGARVFCVGLNYRAHAEEVGRTDLPPYPTLFARWTASLTTDGAPVPAVEEKLDWEGELLAVIGKRLSRVDAAAGLAGVMGYAVFNDVSARTYQRHTQQWAVGKNADGSGPMGDIITADEIGDPAQGLEIVTRVNGEVMQRGSTSQMIYDIGQVIAYISEVITLNPGDLIATGTPDGIGASRKPPIFLKAGDVVEVEIEKVGKISNPVVSVEDYQALSGG